MRAAEETRIEAETPSARKEKGAREESYQSLNLQSPKRILIVDDDFESVKLLQRILTEFGCYIQIATDGIQAIKFLKDASFDLVFLDWKMPKLDGSQTIAAAEKAIAENEDSRSYWMVRKQPVVTYSGRGGDRLTQPDTAHFAFIDHWNKPMDIADLHFQVREILNYISNPPH